MNKKSTKRKPLTQEQIDKRTGTYSVIIQQYNCYTD